MRSFFRYHPELLILPPLIAIILLNILYLDVAVLGSILGIVYLGIILFSFFSFFRQFFGIMESVFFSFVFWMCSVIGLGSIAYFFYRFDAIVFFGILVLPIFGLYFLSCPTKNTGTVYIDESPIFSFSKKYFILLILSFLFSFIIFFFLLRGRTTDAVNNFWGVVDTKILAMFFLVSVLMSIMGLWYRRQRLNLLTHSILLFLISSAVTIVFPLGFGFDTFIHQTAQTHIAQYEILTPKTPYYLGQYVFVVFLSKLFFLSIPLIHTFLVPLTLSILLPLAAWMCFQKKRYGFLALPVLLTLPFSMFLVTTPQAFANLLVLLIAFIVASPLAKKFPRKIIFTILATVCLAAVAIHPLAGIPAVIIVIIFFSRRIAHPLWCALFSITMPALFLLYSALAKNAVFSFKQVPLFSYLMPTISDRFSFFENGMYVYTLNWAFIIIVVAGLSYFFHSKTLLFLRARGSVAFFILLTNALLTLFFIDFSSLIQYERNDFGFRLLEIAFYPLLPVFLSTLLFAFKRISIRPIVLPLFLVLAFANVAAVYVSFPHTDKFQTSKLYTLSQADLKAIEFVHTDAKEKPYAVLANQITSAGALARFGFSHYHETNKGQLYFYPIPTSSPLYSLYLEMAEGTPSQNTIQKVYDLMEVQTVYMIFDSYWTNFENQSQKIALVADASYDINEGKVKVFKFERSSLE